MAFSCIMPFMPFYVRELGVRDEGAVAIWAGALITGSGLMMALCAPLWGTLADRYGRKLMVQRAMFGGAMIISLMALVTNVYQLLALRMLQGALTGTVPASVAMVSAFTPAPRRGYSLGLMQMAVSAGAALGPWLGGTVADHAGYRFPFALTGLLLFVAAMMVTLGVPEDRAIGLTPGGRNGRSTLRGVLGLPHFGLLLGMVFLLSFCNLVTAPVFPLFVESLMRVTRRVAGTVGLLMTVGAVAGGLGAVLVGRLADRYGPRRVLVACTLNSAAGSVLTAIAATVGQLFAIRAFFGPLAGGIQPAVNTLVARLVPDDALGKAYGLATSASAIGMATAPLAGGFLASWLGLRTPFAVAAVAFLILSITLACYQRPQTQEE